jgi:hypothetical protein
MVTVLRGYGLRAVIFSNDHPPAHVHVFGDGEAKIDLLGGDGGPAVIWADNMARSEVRRALQLVHDNRLELLKRWRDIHERHR